METAQLSMTYDLCSCRNARCLPLPQCCHPSPVWGESKRLGQASAQMAWVHQASLAGKSKVGTEFQAALCHHFLYPWISYSLNWASVSLPVKCGGALFNSIRPPE